MYVVGCDFGLVKSGIVVMRDDFAVVSQTLIRVKSKGAQRLVDIEAGFDQIIRPYRDSIEVFVEGYAYGRPYQRESLAELGGVMRRYFCVNELNYWVIPPTSNKKFVTGTTKASKNYMKRMTKEKYGIAFKSDDVCDAHGLARLGTTVLRNRLFFTDMLPEEEDDIVRSVLDNEDQYKNTNTARGKRNNK